MDDLFDYFEVETSSEVLASPPETPVVAENKQTVSKISRYVKLVCTDTAGEPLRKLAEESIRRVLTSPVNLSQDGRNEYALVYCEQLGVGVMRRGARLDSAKFVLFSLAGEETHYAGEEGLTLAMKDFLARLKSRKIESH